MDGERLRDGASAWRARLSSTGLAGVLACALLVGGTFVVATLAGVQVRREVAGGAAHVLVAAMTAAFAATRSPAPLWSASWWSALATSAAS